MRALLATMLAAATMVLAGAALPGAAADAEAAGSLKHPLALRHAERAAGKRARQDQAITGWVIARGFKFSSRKWVFVWWAEMADGRVCSAQLVTRYASLKSSKIVSYFRNDECS